MTQDVHPLKTRSTADLELFLAQALSELTGTNAAVTVDAATFTKPMIGPGNATLQLSVQFLRQEKEGESTLF